MYKNITPDSKMAPVQFYGTAHMPNLSSMDQKWIIERVIIELVSSSRYPVNSFTGISFAKSVHGGNSLWAAGDFFFLQYHNGHWEKLKVRLSCVSEGPGHNEVSVFKQLTSLQRHEALLETWGNTHRHHFWNNQQMPCRVIIIFNLRL